MTYPRPSIIRANGLFFKKSQKCMFPRTLILAASAAGCLLAGPASPNAPGFAKDVQPVLVKTCLPCHNDRMPSGGLNLAFFSTFASIGEQREGWERILLKL